jgi:zinc transport system ATP-binding protein
MHTVTHLQTIIELKDVSFSYSSEQVIKNVSLQIHKGDYVGIIGPNGGGKSTILKIMIGLLKPDKGTVMLFGQKIENFHDWPKIGYVSQKTSIDTNFPVTVEEVVAMGRFGSVGLFSWLKQVDYEKVQKALRDVEMFEFRKRQISDLSGGQQQRVFIARALAAEPEVIFLDEPTVGVDMKTQKQFYDLLRKLNDELDLTLVLASHELDVVAHESTELGYINRTLEYYGDPNIFLKGDYFHELMNKKGIHH